MKLHKFTCLMSLLMAFAFLLTGCGGGSGPTAGNGPGTGAANSGNTPNTGGTTPSPTGNTTASVNYHFYTDSTGKLNAVSEANPGQTQTLSATNITGSFTTIASNGTDISPNAILTVMGGYLYKTPTVSNQALTMTQVSSAKDIQMICSSNSVVTPNQTYFFYTAGTDCSSSATYAVTLNMTSDQTPYTVPSLPLIAVLDSSGNAIGWLFNSGTGLLLYNTQFSYVKTLSTTTYTQAYHGTNGTILLFNSQSVAVYSSTTGVLTENVYQATSGITSVLINANCAYFNDGQNIYGMLDTPSVAPVLMGTDTVGTSPHLVQLWSGQNGQELVYQTTTSNGIALAMMSIANGSVKTIDSGASINVAGYDNNLLYYTKSFVNTSTPPSAIIYNLTNGNWVTKNDAAWAAPEFSPSYDSASSTIDLDKILRADNLSTGTVTITCVNAQTGSDDGAVMTLPTGAVGVYGESFDNTLLLTLAGPNVTGNRIVAVNMSNLATTTLPNTTGVAMTVY